nr:ureidoglycolate lyase [Puniceibacterium confluentis]
MGPTSGALHAFPAAPGRGVSLHPGTWHGVLTPRHGAGLFAVIDRIGSTATLEKFRLSAPDSIIAPGLCGPGFIPGTVQQETHLGCYQLNN